MQTYAYGNINITAVCGLDEAGRGAVAGPIVGAAVILNIEPSTLEQLAHAPFRDGKLLSRNQRTRLFEALHASRSVILVENISARLINTRGISWANKELFRRLIRRIDSPSYVIDGKLSIGNIRSKTARIQSIVDADATIPAVIAAGIVAKVTRDKLMSDLHDRYPAYAWHRNAGYGTKVHKEALLIHGTCCQHRDIFVKTFMGR